MTVPREHERYVGELTSAQIAALPVEYLRAGNFGFDTDLAVVVVYDGSAWVPIGGGPGPGPYPPSPPGLLFDLQMNEGAGDQLFDSANPGRAPVILTGDIPTIWNPLPSGINVLNMQGAESGSLPNADKLDLNFTIESFTFACWINWAGVGDTFQYFISTADTYDDGWRVYIALPPSLVNTSYRDALTNQYNNPMENGSLVPGTWFFVVIVYDAADVIPYLDGVPNINGSDPHDGRPAPIGESTTPLLLGMRTGGQYFNGLFSHPRIWNRALAPPEIILMEAIERPLYL
jgi:hypothetical protein